MADQVVGATQLGLDTAARIEDISTRSEAKSGHVTPNEDRESRSVTELRTPQLERASNSAFY